MRNRWVGFGLVVILGMCLLPPTQLTVHDPYGRKGDRLFGDTTRARTYTQTHLVYRPVWGTAPEEVGAGMKVRAARVAWTWLLLQIFGAGLLFGGLAAFLGSESE